MAQKVQPKKFGDPKTSEILDNLVGPRSQTFGGADMMDEAQALASAQSLRWRRLVDSLPEDVRSKFRMPLENLGTRVEQHSQQAVVHSTLPLILREPRASDVSSLSADGYAAAVQLLSKIAAVSFDSLNRDDLLLAAWVGIAGQSAREAISKGIQGELSGVAMAAMEARGEIDKINRLTREEYGRYQEAAEAARSKYAEATAVADVYAAKTRLDLDGVRERAKEQIDQVRQDAEQAISRLQEAREELVRIGPTVTLWTDKASLHRRGFFWASGLFLILMVLAIALTISLGPRLLTSVATATKDAPLVGVAFVVAPLIGMGWALRLISRVAMQNLTFWDDARQRMALAETYLSFLAERGDRVSSAERTLAVAALFRPPAGQGNDDVAPPTVADILNARTQ